MRYCYLLLLFVNFQVLAIDERDQMCEQLSVLGVPNEMIGNSELQAKGPADMSCQYKSPTGDVLVDEKALHGARQVVFDTCVADLSVNDAGLRNMVEFFSACEF